MGAVDVKVFSVDMGAYVCNHIVEDDAGDSDSGSCNDRKIVEATVLRPATQLIDTQMVRAIGIVSENPGRWMQAMRREIDVDISVNLIDRLVQRTIVIIIAEIGLGLGM